jgi:xanthine dehydrogenase/oxidase
VNASPISDMNPLLIAMNAVLTLQSRDGGARQIPITSFFQSYRKVDIKDDEVLTSIAIPLAREFEYVGAYKQARRRDDDIAIVNGAYRVLLQPECGTWVVKDAACGFGGMAATTIRAKGTEAALLKKTWSLDSLPAVYDALASDMSLPPNVPGGMPEYRMSLAASFLFKFFVESVGEIASDIEGRTGFPAAPVVSERVKSAGAFLPHEHSTSGIQSWGNEEGGLQTTQSKDVYTLTSDRVRGPVGDPVMHKSAREQVTGEAKYTDDIPVPTNTLHCALVLSTASHAEILKIDTSAALAIPGVVAYYGADDVPGDNHIGAVIHDEEFMATKKVVSIGQLIGVIVAEDLRIAQMGAKAVVVTYGEQYPSIISIEDAIAAKSFHPQMGAKAMVVNGEPPMCYSHDLVDGDVDAAMQTADIIVEGEARCGGQEHFYLETNATLCVPHEGGIQMWASTQNPTKSQRFCAKILDIPESRVVCTVKRMGGGFGGKETRSVFISCVAALAAHKLDRPVKITLDRDVDMLITGQRHAFVGKYKVGAKKDGTLVALDVKVYSNAGYSLVRIPIFSKMRCTCILMFTPCSSYFLF